MFKDKIHFNLPFRYFGQKQQFLPFFYAYATPIDGAVQWSDFGRRFLDHIYRYCALSFSCKTPHFNIHSHNASTQRRKVILIEFCDTSFNTLLMSYVSSASTLHFIRGSQLAFMTPK